MGDTKSVNGILVPLTDEEQTEHDARAAQWPTIQMAETQVKNAKAALLTSDVTVWRCCEGQVPVPVEWAAYRQALRAIVKSGGGALPAKPDYPKGT